MKKFAPIAAIALFAVAFTSCKKEWTCECTTTSGGTSNTGTMKSAKMSKKDAKTWCESSNGTSSILGVSYTVDCKIK